MAVLMFVLPLIFTLKVSGQESQFQTVNDAEFHEFLKNAHLPDEANKEVVTAEKDSKLSVLLGFGNAYGLGTIQNGKTELHNSSAFVLRAGYSLNKYTEVQGEYSEASGFGKSESGEYMVGPYHEKYQWSDNVGISNYSVNLKIRVPIILKKTSFSPYVLGGIGRASLSESYSGREWEDGALISNIKKSWKYNGLCLKSGLGIDVTVHKNLALFMEYNYQKMRLGGGNHATVYYSQTLGGVKVKF